MAFCEHCGTTLRDNANFCGACGQETLPAGAHRPAAPGAPRPPAPHAAIPTYRSPHMGAMPAGAAMTPPTGYGAVPPGMITTTARPGSGLVVAITLLMVASWIMGIIFVISIFAAGSTYSRSEEEIIAVTGLLWGATTLPTIILWLVWLHGSWAAVPPAYRTASPGEAVGYLFIPFFNLYWMFRAIPGLSRSISNALYAQAPGREETTGHGLGIAACVIALIPYVNMVSAPLFIVWMFVANAAKNRMLSGMAGQP